MFKRSKNTKVYAHQFDPKKDCFSLASSAEHGAGDKIESTIQNNAELTSVFQDGHRPLVLGGEEIQIHLHNEKPIIIGEGCYGINLRGTLLSTNQLVAIKLFRNEGKFTLLIVEIP